MTKPEHGELLVRQRSEVEPSHGNGLAIWHIDEAKASNFIYNNDQGFPGQVGWSENNQHYTVALLQADGQYGLERGYNRGDAGDVYAKSSKKSPAPTLGPGRLDPKVHPNTNTYRGGVVYQADVKFSNVSVGGTTFRLTVPVHG